MRIGRLQINWNPPAKKVDRKIDLELFYTFKDGSKIYTYKVQDLAKISGRYLDQVKNTLNFMLQYAAGPEQVRAFSRNIQAEAKEALDGKKDKTEALIRIHEVGGQMPKLQDYVSDLEAKKWYDLYTMFFVLEGEPECMFSDKWNAKKIELLENESDEVKEVFFSFLDSLMIQFSNTYREDLLNSMAKERELASLATSLTSLTTSLNMK